MSAIELSAIELIAIELIAIELSPIDLSAIELRIQSMSEESRQALKVFFTNWILIGALFGFNLLHYLKRGGKLALAVTLICGSVFIGWGAGYFFFFKPRK
ncbi:MAG: hypothetical protein DMF61_18825 [Blastocatellia bacterium AA13]|nr:MAG: hypothetical protein DMF61_18825 [Blastocatellia bacterium AA13]